ncbi:hypothetical protein MMC15_006325 [Xylographa vitiligo]|nr:hypothetical protein [Xylographa vitiligo]
MIQEIKELREKNTWVDLILKAIRTSEGGEILKRLKNGETYDVISQSLERPPFPGFSSLSPKSQVQLTKAIAEFRMDLEGERNAGDLVEGHGWTNVTHNEDLIDHLLALYFTWVHPVYMIFSENHFMASFKNRSDLYCTKALVNAILAMACHLYDEDDDASLWPGVDPEYLRSRFLDEARTLLPQDDQPKMTTIQTLALVFLVELGNGKGSRASHYIRLAADSLNTRLEQNYSTEAMEITRRGIYSLNVAWSSLTYQMPNMQGTAEIAAEDVFHRVQLDSHDALWRFYRHAGDYAVTSERPSSAVLVASETARLMRLVHESIRLLYDSRDTRITARLLLKQYRAYLDWERALPEMIALPSGISSAVALEESVPHVLSLHIAYHTAQIHLFQPFLHSSDFSGPVRQHIMSITVDHARKAYEAMVLYRELFTCRYQPSLQTFYLLHVCDVLVRFSPSQPSSSDVVQFCLENLRETADGRGGFAICGPLQEMFRRTAEICGAPIPEDLENIMGSGVEYTTEDFLNACTRLSYKQPVENIILNMDRHITIDFAHEWKELIDTSGDSSTGPSERVKSMRIDNLLND